MKEAPKRLWKDDKTGDVWDANGDTSFTVGLTEYIRADALEALIEERDRLREADQIIADLMADDTWRTAQNDLYGRMVKYRRAALQEKTDG